MNKINVHKKHSDKDQQTIKSFDKLYIYFDSLFDKGKDEPLFVVFSNYNIQKKKNEYFPSINEDIKQKLN